MRQNRIAEIRKSRGLSQRALADLLEAHWVTVSKLERGQMQLTMEWARRLQVALDVSLIELVGADPVRREVEIYGVLKDDGFIGDIENPHDFFDLKGAGMADPFSRWVVNSGNALWPIFYPGDFLRFSPVPKEDWHFVVDRLVCCSFDDGAERYGILQRARTGDAYALRPLNGAPVDMVGLTGIGLFEEAVAAVPDGLFK